MAKLSVKVGATSVSLAVFIQDSASTTGAGKSGLAFNTSSLTCYAVVPGSSSAAITLATLAAANSAWSSGGFKEIDATNMIGWYRFDIPNTNISTGRSVGIHFQGASGMAPLPLEIELTGWDNQDAVRGGMTALPNAAAEAAGGLYTRGSGAGQINQAANGQVDTNVARWLNTAVSTPTVAGVPNVNAKTWNDLATVALPLVPTTAGRTLDVSAGGEAGLDWANVGSPTTANGLTGTTISTAQVVASVTGAVGSVTGAVGSVTGAVGSVAGNVGGNVVGSVASVAGNVGGNVTGSVGSVVGAVGSVAGNVGGNVVGSVASVTAAVAITSNIKKNQALAAFEFLMTDSTNHNPSTGLAVTVTRSIDAGAFAAGALSAVTEVGSGIYSVDFAAGDLNGKVIVLKATAALSDTRFERIVTQP